MRNVFFQSGTRWRVGAYQFSPNLDLVQASYPSFALVGLPGLSYFGATDASILTRAGHAPLGYTCVLHPDQRAAFMGENCVMEFSPMISARAMGALIVNECSDARHERCACLHRGIV